MKAKVDGILEFAPVDVTKKHKSQSSWKCVAIIKTNCDIDRYYAWFLKKRFNLELIRNLRGAHITFINDRMDREVFEGISKLFDGKPICFELNLTPQSNGEHWWLPVTCDAVASIREICGLQKKPYYDLHLTLGHVNEKNLDHSKYILDVCDFYGIL